MIRYLVSFIVFFLLVPATFALDASTVDIQNDIIPTTDNMLVNVGSSDGFDILDNLLLYIKDSIFGLLALLAIGVFLYTGTLLITARGNPEQFKKAMYTFLYAVIGLVIVTLAWAAVRLVAGLSF